MEELTKSIEERHGLIQPITVREKKDFYEVVAGHRRWHAYGQLGYEKIPAIVGQFTDEQMLETGLVENLQRKGINPIEEATGYAMLKQKFNWTQSEIAKRTGKSRDYIAQRLRLLTFPKKIRELVSHDIASASVVEAIASTTQETQSRIISKIETGWKPTVEQVTTLARSTGKDTHEKANPLKGLLPRVVTLEEEIALIEWSLLFNEQVPCPRCFEAELKPDTVLIDGVQWVEYTCIECGLKFNTKELDGEKPLYNQIFKIAEKQD